MPEPSVQELLDQASLHSNRREFAEALTLLEQVFVVDPDNEDALFRKADVLRLQGKLDDAARFVNDALTRHPDNASLLAEHGWVLLAQNRPDATLAPLDRALEIVPAYEFAWVGKARALRMLKRFDEAHAALDALDVLPDNTRLLYERGWSYYDEQRFGDAIAAFEATLAIKGDNEDAWYGKISALRAQKELARADAAINDALRAVPNSVRLLNQRGWWNYDQARYGKAIEAFDAALAVENGNEDAWYWKISALRAQKELARADAVITDALRAVPNSVRLLNQRGWWNYDQARYGKAIEAFDATLAVDGRNEDAWLSKARAFREERDFVKADAVLTEALGWLPQNTVLLNERGWGQLAQRQYAEAVAAFDRTLAVDAKNDEALALRVGALRLLRCFDEADRALRDALVLLPKSTGLLNQRGWWYVDQRRYAEAVDAFDAALAVDGRNEDAWSWKIRMLRTLRRFDDADDALVEAVKRLPKSTRILSERGWWYLDQFRYDEAVAAFDAALNIDPSNEDLLLWKAQTLRTKGAFDEADQLLNTALATRPNSPDLLVERGWIAFLQRRYSYAVAAFELALNADADNDDAIQGKARSLRADRRFDDTAAFLSAMLERRPDNPALLAERGWLYYDQDRFQDADQSFKAAAVADPANIDHRTARIHALVPLHRSDEARRILQAILAAEPANLEVRGQLGWFHIKNNDPHSAKREFEAIVADDPASVLGLNGLGGVALDLGRYDEAELKFRAAAEIAPYQPALHANIGWTLARRPRPAPPRAVNPLLGWFKPPATSAEPPDPYIEAEKLCRKALEIDPDLSSAYECLGVIAFKQRRIRDAEDHFLDSIRVDPPSGGYMALGAFYVSIGRFAEAEERLKTALSRNPNDAAALLEMGNLYLAQSQPATAIRYMREAAERAPQNEEAARALSVALRRSGDVVESEQVLRRAIATIDGSRCATLHLTLANLLTQLGDDTDDESYYGDALTEINKSIALNPRDPDAYFHAGVIRYRLDDLPKALKNFRKCKDLDESRFDAERNFKIIQKSMKRERKKARGLMASGLTLGIICLGLLGVLWSSYFGQWSKGAVTGNMIYTFTPLLLTLSFVGFLVPWLLRFKLPGIEAELSQATETVSKGPTGSIGFRTPSISVGPR